MCRAILASTRRQDRAAQGAILKYDEGLDSAGFNPVNDALNLSRASTIDSWERWETMKLTRVHRGFFNSNGYLSQWVLLDQCQAAADAVEHVGSDEGDVVAGENIKLDHFSR